MPEKEQPMRLKASSILTLDADSCEAAKAAARTILDNLGTDEPKLLLVYGTINHEQTQILESLRSAVGSGPLIVGCSAQGVVSNGQLTEEGYGLGVMGFAGTELRAAVGTERSVHENPRQKGERVARQIRDQLGTEPQIVCVHYDASRGVNAQEMLAGMGSVVSCPFVGGGASLSWGLPVSTYQYIDTQALQGGIVAFGLSGPFDVEIGVCHGTTPTGVVMTVTRSDGNRILEIDGRPAAQVFSEATGHVPGELLRQDHLVSWALAIERMVSWPGLNGPELRSTHMIRAAGAVDYETGAVRVQAGFPEGTRVALHHRSVDAVLEGTKAMGQELTQRLAGRKPWAAMGFECRGRTVPFLGTEGTMAEHDLLYSQIGRDVPWIGMMAWGEIASMGNEPAFHNYTYPVALLVPRA
jgi:hypothetical protein